MNSCPNKASKEWKTLVDQVGEDLSWATWAYYGYNYPATLNNVSSLKRALSIKSPCSENQYLKLAERVTKYNNKYGTAHSFTPVQVGQADLYDIDLKINYLPKKVVIKTVYQGDNSVLGNEYTKAFINNNPEVFISEGNQYIINGEVYGSYEDAINSSLDYDRPFAEKLFRNYEKDFIPADKDKVYELLALAKNQGISGVLNHIISNTKDPIIKIFAKAFLDNIDRAGFLQIKFDVARDRYGNYVQDASGSYGGGIININWKKVFFNATNLIHKNGLDSGYKSIIHELVHVYTLQALRNPQTSKEKEFKNKITKAYNTLKQDAAFKSDYGLSSVEEFISEIISNPEFRGTLNIYKAGFLAKIINYIAKLFGYTKDISMEESNRTSIIHETVNTFLKDLPYLTPSKGKSIYYDKVNNIKPGVSELFKSNPELANTVYEALGYKSEDYKGIGKEDLDNLIDDKLNVNWDLLDRLQEELFSKEAKWTLKNRPEKHSGESFTWEHIQNVVESAKKIPIPNNVDRKTLILAALLHDIGKPYRNEDHALDSVKVINRLFKDNKYSKLVKLAVRHHMISTSTTQEEYKKIIQDAQSNGIKSEDFIELLLALNIADITRNRAEDIIDDYSGKSIKDTLAEEIPLKRHQLESISQQQKQQAQQLYSQYLDTIFPNSKVKDIVYHGSSEIREELDPSKQIRGRFGKGVSFASTPELVKQLIDNPVIHSAIINLQNPLTDVPRLRNEVQPAVEKGNHDGVQVGKIEYTVPTKEQIHILGSKQDIEGFKEFISSNNVNISLLPDSISDIRSDVVELFESNPKLATEVYETIGFKSTIIEKDIEDVVTNALKEKIFRVGKSDFEKTELSNINVYTKKESAGNFSVAIDNKGTSMFGLVTAVLDFQRRDLDSDSIYSPNPNGFILWNKFLDSSIAHSKKAKIIVDNRLSIASGVLKALKNNGIKSIHFPERFADNFREEYSQFLKQNISYVGYVDTSDNYLSTIEISIDDLIRFIDFKNNTNNTDTSLLPAQYQLQQGREVEEFVATEKTIRDLAARMSDRIGIPVMFESDRTKQYKGKIEDNIAYINLAYATLDTPIHEVLGHPIIRQLKTTNNVLYNSLLKELEYGKGKEVLNRIKRDYKSTSDKEYLLRKIDPVTGAYSKIKSFNSQEELNEYKKNNILTGNWNELVKNKFGDKIYSLEEQQEEAIVELLGLYTADRLDKVKDGKLISLLKRLLKEMKAFMKKLLSQREVEIDKLPDNMTLGNIADLLAYSNSKLILPGSTVIYTTPDNQTFKTYAEASNHISQLAKSVEDVDLSDVKINPNLEKEIAEKRALLEKQLKQVEDDIREANNELSKLVFVGEKMTSNFEFTDKYKDYLNKYTEFTAKILTPLRNKEKEIFEQINEIRLEEGIFGSSGKTILNFIQKNKEFEQSKEIIEEWKRINNIQYNPEEVYSRGQEFVSIVGAYSEFDVNLMMQNLLQHIEDNQKSGGEFTISAFTKPIDKNIGHLEDGGGKIKFKIYPKSEDIKWAANTDVYSGSVWDASEKVNKDKKSELLGVSYTKYPALANVTTIQPNLVSIIDDLAHRHNELGISLTGNNFRLEYDEDIPYSTKKIINGINSILDQKYGKLIKPEIKKGNSNAAKLLELINKLQDLQEKEEELYSTSDYDSINGVYAEKLRNEIKEINQQIQNLKNTKITGIKPTQTNETLKESIGSVKNKIQFEFKYSYFNEYYKDGYRYVYLTRYNKYSKQKDGELINITKEEYERDKPKKEYTSQALINTKIAKLKEVAKKYPRSLIRSEVVYINNNLRLFEDDDLPFQKLDSNNVNIVEDLLPAANNNPSVGNPLQNGTRFQAVIDSYIERSKALRDSIARLKVKRKESNDPVEKANLYKRISKLQKAINEIESTDPSNPGLIKKVSQISALENIIPYAEAQLKNVRDILKADKITIEDLKYAEKIVALWIKAGDFSGREHLFWTQSELEDSENNPVLQEALKQFSRLKIEADIIKSTLINPIRENIAKKSVEEQFGKKAIPDLHKAIRDVNWGTMQALDISEVNNPLVQAMHSYLKKANFKAFTEATTISETIDTLIKKIGKVNWDLFKQTFSNTDNRETGNLVYRFSQVFFDERSTILSNARASKNAKARAQAYKKLVKFNADKTIIFDVRKLFPGYWNTTFTQQEIDAHIKELKDTLGEYGYNKFYEKAKENIDKYILDLESQKQIIEDNNTVNGVLNKSAYDIELANWVRENSPAAEAEIYSMTSNEINNMSFTPSGTYSVKVPKRFINGKDTGYYDKKFETIESNEDLRNLYEILFDTINELKAVLPYEDTKWMQINSLPTVYKNILDQYGEDGMAAGLNPLMDALAESSRTSDLSTTDYRYRNLSTGDPDKHIQTSMMIDYNNKIKELVKLKIVEYKLENNSNPSMDQINEFKKDAANKIAQEKSFDLGKVTKMYVLMALSYKHKAAIQHIMESLEHTIKNTPEIGVNPADAPLYDKNGNPIKLNGRLSNLSTMLDTFMDYYYGYKMDKPFGKTKSKVYTSKENEKKDNLEEALQLNESKYANKEITESEYNSNKEVLTEMLEMLGGVRTWSKYGDMFLQYVQVKGMGWNIFAGITNMLYGFISNVIEASDGRNYDQESFWKAQSKVLRTVGGNKFTDEAIKIRSLMKKLDILKDSRYELYDSTSQSAFGKFKKKFKALNPYTPQTSTEFINQATVLVAMMLHNKVMVDGNEMSLYDCFDKDGVLKEGITLPEDFDLADFKIRVDKVIKLNHGNYDPDSPLNLKRQLLGRALSQFRTWSFQGFSERFMGEMYDYQLGMVRKGRYRSYVDFYKTMKDNDVGYIASTFYITKQLLRKASFGVYNTEFGEIQGLSEVDAANMRKNMTELVVLAMLTAVALLLKGLVDKDRKGPKYLAYFYLNQITRLSTDLMFYTSPSQFEKLTRNAMPAFSAVIDLEDAMAKSINYIVDNESDEIKTGVNAHKSKAFRAINKVVPNPYSGLGRVMDAAQTDYSTKPLK